MLIPGAEIFSFYAKRTQCHIDSLNYFAGLLGYHFPEHDCDKNRELIRTGYAYRVFVLYHPNCGISQAALDACDAAQIEHHKTATHHTEHYQNVSEISKTTLVEMICDWHSADFEQKNILHECNYDSVLDFFTRVMGPKEWTPPQREFILNTIQELGRLADRDRVYEIWRPLVGA